MEQEVLDSTRSLFADTLQAAPPQSEYFIGTLVTVFRGENQAACMPLFSDSGRSIIYSPAGRQSGERIAAKALNTDICFILLSFSLVLLTLLTVYGRKSVFSVFSSLSIRRQHESSQPGQATITWPAILKNLFAILNISLFAVVSSSVLGYMTPQNNWWMIKNMLVIMAGLTGAQMIRHLICKFTGIVSGHQPLFREYLSVVYNVWFLVALIAFIDIIIILYTPLKTPELLIYISSGAMILLFLIRIIRLLNIFIRRHVPILYFILYLCALEVLPVLVALKLFGVF